MFSIYCLPYVSFILVITSYLLGSIPFGLIISYIKGHGDIRKHGSGNIGATNVLRNAGKIGGALTLILDAGKGILALLLARSLCADYLLLIFCGVAAIIGHIFPVWLKFKGGKGVATGLAIITFLNYGLGMVIISIWLLTFLLLRTSSISALVSFVVLPIAAYIMTYNPRLTIACTIISILVIIRHVDNIKRLITGEE